MSYSAPSLPDKVAQTSVDLYKSLRNHGKPTRRPNNVEEWTILATISLVFPSTSTIIPVSLGTGVKVLPASRLPPLGDAVHDSHAEVLARRGFVRWMMEEAKASIPLLPEDLAERSKRGSRQLSGESGSDKDKRRRRKERARMKKEEKKAETVEMEPLDVEELEIAVEKNQHHDAHAVSGIAEKDQQREEDETSGRTKIKGTKQSGTPRPLPSSSTPSIALDTDHSRSSGLERNAQAIKASPAGAPSLSSTTPTPFKTKTPNARSVAYKKAILGYGSEGSQAMSRNASGATTSSSGSSMSSFLGLPRVVPGSKAFYAQAMARDSSADSVAELAKPKLDQSGGRSRKTKLAEAGRKKEAEVERGVLRPNFEEKPGTAHHGSDSSTSAQTKKIARKEKDGKQIGGAARPETVVSPTLAAHRVSTSTSPSLATGIDAGKGCVISKEIEPEPRPNSISETDSVSSSQKRRDRRNANQDRIASRPGNDFAHAEEKELASSSDSAPTSDSSSSKRMRRLQKARQLDTVKESTHEDRDDPCKKEEGEVEEEKLFTFEDGKFRLRKDIEIWLYVSTLPVSLATVCLDRRLMSSVVMLQCCTPPRTRIPKLP